MLILDLIFPYRYGTLISIGTGTSNIYECTVTVSFFFFLNVSERYFDFLKYFTYRRVPYSTIILELLV